MFYIYRYINKQIYNSLLLNFSSAFLKNKNKLKKT